MVAVLVTQLTTNNNPLYPESRVKRFDDGTLFRRDPVTGGVFQLEPNGCKPRESHYESIQNSPASNRIRLRGRYRRSCMCGLDSCC